MFRIFFLVLIVLLVLSCKTSERRSRSRNTQQAGCIPPDFGDTSQVLLVIVGKPDMYPVIAGKGYDYYEEKNFEENYKGHYLIVHIDSLDAPKYADLGKYRYTFNYEALEKIALDPYRDKTFVTYDRLFIIRDRTTQQDYKAVYHTQSWYRVMNGLITNMNVCLGYTVSS